MGLTAAPCQHWLARKRAAQPFPPRGWWAGKSKAQCLCKANAMPTSQPPCTTKPRMQNNINECTRTTRTPKAITASCAKARTNLLFLFFFLFHIGKASMLMQSKRNAKRVNLPALQNHACSTISMSAHKQHGYRMRYQQPFFFFFNPYRQWHKRPAPKPFVQAHKHV